MVLQRGTIELSVSTDYGLMNLARAIWRLTNMNRGKALFVEEQTTGLTISVARTPKNAFVVYSPVDEWGTNVRENCDHDDVSVWFSGSQGVAALIYSRIASSVRKDEIKIKCSYGPNTDQQDYHKEDQCLEKINLILNGSV